LKVCLELQVPVIGILRLKKHLNKEQIGAEDVSTPD